MLLTREVEQSFELSQKGSRVEIEGTSAERRILLSSSGVCGYSFDVQQYTVLFDAGEHCVVGVSTAQDFSYGS